MLGRIGERLFGIDANKVDGAESWFACIFEFPPHSTYGSCTPHFFAVFDSEEKAREEVMKKWDEIKKKEKA